MANAELKPCPFCGGLAFAETVNDICCDDSKCIGNLSMGSREDWNTRAAPAVPDGELPINEMEIPPRIIVHGIEYVRAVPDGNEMEQARQIVDATPTWSEFNNLDEDVLIKNIATALRQRGETWEEERIQLHLEIARLRVKSVVDAEKQSENLDDVMNLRFTSGR